MTKPKSCCPLAEEIKQLQQLERIYSANLSNHTFTTPKDTTITMKQPKK